MLPHEAVELPAEFLPAREADPSLSWWTRSQAKRAFDVLLMLASAPLLLPLAGAIALAILVFCGRPILFRQTRAGRHGELFTIFKFRTMAQADSGLRLAIAAHAATEVTPFGRMLRRTKVDELPQVWNVLAGDMSLVGPRPKVPEQQPVPLPCRPGLTGPATLAFAYEEQMFADIPRDQLDSYYREVVLPAKYRLDSDYMARATVSSDLVILLRTALGCWRNLDSAPDSPV